jgi:TonB family protein
MYVETARQPTWYLLAAVFLLCTAGSATASIPEQSSSTVAGAVPLYLANPEYPITAQLHCTPGSVTFIFTVGTNGLARNIVVAGMQPSSIFEESARLALKRSIFKPRHLNGKPVPSRVRYTYQFHGAQRLPANGAQSKLLDAVLVLPKQPRYPLRALQQGDDATVTLNFTVDKNGQASKVVTAYAQPLNGTHLSPSEKKAFVRSSKEALKRSRFAPNCAEGRPIASRATFTYRFTIPDKKAKGQSGL